MEDTCRGGGGGWRGRKWMTIDSAAGQHSQAFVAFILDRQPSHALGRKEDERKECSHKQ